MAAVMRSTTATMNFILLIRVVVLGAVALVYS